MSIDFNAKDREIINAIELRWTKGSMFPINFNIIIKNWQNLVNECKDGYNDVVEEFTNDLSSRDIIQQILEEISDDGKNIILKFIEPLDKIFIDNTVKVDKPLMTYEWIKDNKQFWYFRVPKRIKRDELSAFESQLGDSLDGKIEVLE